MLILIVRQSARIWKHRHGWISMWYPTPRRPKYYM